MPAGSSSADVRSKLGAPSDERTLAGGVKAWDYVQGPQGWTTYRVVFDGSDRVTRVEQLLTDRSFNALQAGTATRADATARLGRPGQVTTYPARGEEVWTYRYMSGTTYMLGDVYFNAADGVVKGVSTYFDPAYYSTYSS